MNRRKQFSSRGLAYEGQGSVPPVSKPVLMDYAGSNPFGDGIRHPVEEAFSRWLQASAIGRYEPGALHQLRESLRGYDSATVKRVIRETFVGSDREDIRSALRACGLLKEKKPGRSRLNEASGRKKTVTEEELLAEAVVYIPRADDALRSRIEKFLRGEE